MTRYYDIDSGTILVDGQDLSKLTQRSLRRQVGVVLQEAFLFTDTVMNNLKYAREGATDEDASRRPRRPTPTTSSWSCPRATTPC
ncbi:MAG: hypothetical protein GWN58_40015 [Anaerolineae bacterium]|nr:hypothetical protein [Anaerolineae bacterium]